MKYYKWEKKRNSTKTKDLNLMFDQLYKEHYNLKKIQKFQNAN